MTFNLNNHFLAHLAKFQNITDSEIEKMATSEFGGLDAEQCLLLHLERDFVKSFNNSVINGLKELSINNKILKIKDWKNKNKKQ